MTQKQIYQQLADFLGDWKRAKDMMPILTDNAPNNLRKAKSMEVRWGKFHNGTEYYGEDRDTIVFAFDFGYPWNFTIIQ